MILAGSQAPVVAEKLHELSEGELKGQEVAMARIDTITGYLRAAMKIGTAAAQVRCFHISNELL